MSTAAVASGRFRASRRGLAIDVGLTNGPIAPRETATATHAARRRGERPAQGFANDRARVSQVRGTPPAPPALGRRMSTGAVASDRFSGTVWAIRVGPAGRLHAPREAAAVTARQGPGAVRTFAIAAIPDNHGETIAHAIRGGAHHHTPSPDRFEAARAPRRGHR
jgi:hypothetical protein